MNRLLLAAGVCAAAALAVPALPAPASCALIPAFRLSHAQIAWSRAYWRMASRPDSRRYDALIEAAARAHGVDARLLRSVMAAESNFDRGARSNRGAVGLMQVMPATARGLGIRGRLTDPAVNIAAGAAYLAELQREASARLGARGAADPRWLRGRIVAAYNAGPRALTGGHWCRQTRLYVQKVQFYYDMDLAARGPDQLTPSAVVASRDAP